MGTLVTYRLEQGIATVTMDDGKANVQSPQMLGELNGAFARAEQDSALVVLTGREGVFSGGFDLNTLRAGGTAAFDMLHAGFELAERILSFPLPVVVACSGHAVAMGVFLVLSGDYRIGTAGPYKITANEVAIGLTMPRAAIEICRQRLAPAHFNRAVLLAELYAPETAVEAGFLDRVVPAAELAQAAQSTATQLAKLNLKAHTATKLRVRAPLFTALRAAIEADAAEHAGL